MARFSQHLTMAVCFSALTHADLVRFLVIAAAASHTLVSTQEKNVNAVLRVGTAA